MVVEDTSQFTVDTLPIGGHLRDRLVEALEFLGLVLNILLQGGLQDLVLLCGLLVSCCSIRLLGLLLGQIACEVGFAHLEDVDDAAGSTAALGVARWLRRLLQQCSRTVVVTEHLECLAHTAQAQGQLGRGLLVCGILLTADFVHTALLRCHSCKFLLGFFHFILQLSGASGGLVDLGGCLGNGSLKFLLLGLGLGHLLVTIGLLLSIGI